MNGPELKNVLITGGAGYVGSALTPQLLEAGYNVTVYDIFFFGEGTLPLDHPNLTVVKGDIRDTEHFARTLPGIDAVLHLACISNDPSFELDDGLSTSINFDCFEGLVLAAKQAGVKRFVNCSSSSVYGVSEAPEVTEKHPLVPLTLYSKFKGMCETVLFAHQSSEFTCVTIMLRRCIATIRVGSRFPTTPNARLTLRRPAKRSLRTPAGYHNPSPVGIRTGVKLGARRMRPVPTIIRGRDVTFA